MLVRYLLVLVAALAFVSTVSAHHSDAGIDMESVVALEGTVTDDLGLAERTVVGVLQDLRLEGYLHVRKKGRNNIYRVNLDAPMQRAEHERFTLREFLAHTELLLNRHLSEVLNVLDS